MSRSRRFLRLSMTALALVFVGLISVLSPALATAGSATTPAPKVSLPEIEDEVMCPTCRTLLSLSASPAAQRERAMIRKLIRQGKTKEEIKQALVAEYGGQVLAEPEGDGINLWAYVIPTALLLLAAVAVIGGIIGRRRRSDSDGDASEDDESQHSEDPAGNLDQERLDRDMDRFDL